MTDAKHETLDESRDRRRDETRAEKQKRYEAHMQKQIDSLQQKIWILQKIVGATKAENKELRKNLREITSNEYYERVIRDLRRELDKRNMEIAALRSEKIGKDMRIAIAGHPLSNKSVLAASLPWPYRATDSLLDNFSDWDYIVSSVAAWFDQPPHWIIFGVVVPHALREWNHNHRGAPPPLDYFCFIKRPTFDGLTKGQLSMAKGIDTVMDDIRRWLIPIAITERGLRQLYVPITEKST